MKVEFKFSIERYMKNVTLESFQDPVLKRTYAKIITGEGELKWRARCSAEMRNQIDVPVVYFKTLTDFINNVNRIWT